MCVRILLLIVFLSSNTNFTFALCNLLFVQPLVLQEQRGRYTKAIAEKMEVLRKQINSLREFNKDVFDEANQVLDTIIAEKRYDPETITALAKDLQNIFEYCYAFGGQYEPINILGIIGSGSVWDRLHYIEIPEKAKKTLQGLNRKLAKHDEKAALQFSRNINRFSEATELMRVGHEIQEALSRYNKK